MRVARIGNLYQPVPAVDYGGTQRSMAQMTTLQAAICAHDITLYASKDSGIIEFSEKVSKDLGLLSCVDAAGDSIAITNANGAIGRVRLKSADISSIGYDDPLENEKHHKLFSQLLQDEQANPYDIIHNHYRQYMAQEIIPRGLSHKTLVHLHTDKLEDTYSASRYPLICISKSQSSLIQEKYNANVFNVVYHGLDTGTYKPTTEDAGYLAWIGRFLPEKGAHRAIKIAKEAQMPLVIAGVLYEKKKGSKAHFENDVQPYVDINDLDFLRRIANMRSLEVKEEIARLSKESGKENPVIFCGSARPCRHEMLAQSKMQRMWTAARKEEARLA